MTPLHSLVWKMDFSYLLMSICYFHFWHTLQTSIYL